MRIMLFSVAIAASTAAHAQTVDLSDLWMACDLAQVDAAGDAPMADEITSVRVVEQPRGGPALQISAATEAGDALFCEMNVDVVTFRHNDATIVGE